MVSSSQIHNSIFLNDFVATYNNLEILKNNTTIYMNELNEVTFTDYYRSTEILVLNSESRVPIHEMVEIM